MKFNPKEISLCKQVVERHRKDLKIGMYVWRKFDKTVQLIYRLDEKEKDIYAVILKTGKLEKHYWNNLEGGWLTPLWTISDCLEFLRKEKLRFTLYACELNEYSMSIIDDKNTIIVDTIGAKTPLEACLKAVLAVLEENKK